jgi:hypothetical protein
MSRRVLDDWPLLWSAAPHATHTDALYVSCRDPITNQIRSRYDKPLEENMQDVAHWAKGTR